MYNQYIQISYVMKMLQNNLEYKILPLSKC